MIKETKQILDEWFDNGNIKDENRLNYFVLCDYFNVPFGEKTFKCKHFKKLKKRFKKEVSRATK